MTPLAYSDNGYFQRAGMKMGNQKLVEYGQKLGLGQLTGINLEGEAAGRLPYSNSNPKIYSHGDDTEVSTLQLAVLAPRSRTAAIACCRVSLVMRSRRQIPAVLQGRGQPSSGERPSSYPRHDGSGRV